MIKPGLTAATAARRLSMTIAAVGLLQLASPAAARTAATTQDVLLDRIQIEEMMTEYYAAITSEERHSLGDYFTEDAVLEANGLVIEGRDAIQALYDTAGDPRILEGSIYNMMLDNSRITVNGDTATMNAIWTGVISDDVWSTPRILEQGSESTEFVKRDGVWFITKRVITHQGGMPALPIVE